MSTRGMAAEASPAARSIERFSVLTCPVCGHRAREEMPVDACAFFHECAGCGERLRPLPGHCCVFCSYGTVPCPPKQTGCCSA